MAGYGNKLVRDDIIHHMGKRLFEDSVDHFHKQVQKHVEDSYHSSDPDLTMDKVDRAAEREPTYYDLDSLSLVHVPEPKLSPLKVKGMNKNSFIDVCLLAKNFFPGDIVCRYNLMSGDPVEITGIVTASLHGIGFVDVEFPWGNERVSADELLRLSDNGVRYLPPMYDTSYSSWDADQARAEHDVSSKIASEHLSCMDNAMLTACSCHCNDLPEEDTLETIVNRYPIATRIAKVIVADVYKNALYYVGEGRKYRMSLEEMADGKPNCPRCQSDMGKTVYKKYTKLFVCPECFFCITPEDIDFRDDTQEAAVEDSFDFIDDGLE